MRFLRFALAGVCIARLTLAPRAALASNPVGGCTEQTHGAACNHDGTNPCSGVCLPDFSQAEAPMACLPADTSVKEDDFAISGVEGYACSPTGAVGTDCTHTCRSGACVAISAPSGNECIPADGGTNVCNGACDGNGACTLLAHDIETYGRDFAGCTYVACRPTANASKSGESYFAVPEGTPCDNMEQCEVDDHCLAGGGCVGTTLPNCTPDYGDSGADDSEDDDAGTEPEDATASVAEAGVKHDASASSTSTSSGGCDVGGAGDFGALSMGPLFALMWLERRARRRAGNVARVRPRR